MERKLRAGGRKGKESLRAGGQQQSIFTFFFSLHFPQQSFVACGCALTCHWFAVAACLWKKKGARWRKKISREDENGCMRGKPYLCGCCICMMYSHLKPDWSFNAHLNSFAHCVLWLFTFLHQVWCSWLTFCNFIPILIFSSVFFPSHFGLGSSTIMTAYYRPAQLL